MPSNISIQPIKEPTRDYSNEYPPDIYNPNPKFKPYSISSASYDQGVKIPNYEGKISSDQGSGWQKIAYLIIGLALIAIALMVAYYCFNKGIFRIK